VEPSTREEIDDDDDDDDKNRDVVRRVVFSEAASAVSAVSEIEDDARGGMVTVQ
jgi:hypothetical protein